MKAKKEKPVYTVYFIRNDNVIYIGRTNNIKRRQSEHNRNFNKGDEKELYVYLRSINYNQPIVLEPIRTFESKTEAKRFEAYCILHDYFSRKNLKQAVPNISDR